MYSNKKTPWIFGWNPPWNRKDVERKQDMSSGDQHTQRSTNISNDEPLFYNRNNYYSQSNDNALPSQLDMTALDAGYISPPLSSSSSSITSGSRRNTKASLLDFFHRRKSSTPSVMSLQQSSSVGTYSTGQKPTSGTALLPSSSTKQSTSYAGHYSLSCSLPTSSSDNNITSISTATGMHSTPPSLHPTLQHHRFPFIYHSSETTNSNMSSPPSNVSSSSSSVEEHHHHHQFPRPSSLLSPPSYHLPSPLSPPPPHHHYHHHHHHHHHYTAQQQQHQSSNAANRPYATLLKKHSSSLYEQPVGTLMEDNSRPTALDQDIKRITLGHELVKLALDGLFKSPLESNQEGERQVLQIGCGNGSWCIDFAKENPHCFVLGLDDPRGGSLISAATVKKMMNSLVPPSSSASSISSAPANPPGNNYLFIKSTLSLVDSLKRLPEGHFDLVYGRFLALALPRGDYEALVAECWRVCKAGGFVEFTELDMRIYGYAGHSPLVQDLNQQVTTAMTKKNLDPRLPRHLQDLFFKLLVDGRPAKQNSYQVKYNSLPLGVWGGRLGVMFRDDIRDVLEALEVATCDWKASSDTLDDVLEAQMAFMNLYQIFVKKTNS